MVWSRPGGALSTTEHLLAALHLRGVTDLDLSAEGEELPVLEGSAWAWLRALDQTGFKEGPLVSRRCPRRPLRVEVAGAVARWLPGGVNRVSVAVDFGAGRKGHAWWRPGDPDLPLAAARTFVPIEQAEVLRRAGRGVGADRANTLLWGGEDLAWPAEPVWHKLLDALGDLWLAGPVAGAIDLWRPTHALTLALLRRADAVGWRG